jgi:hypothetical protein
MHSKRVLTAAVLTILGSAACGGGTHWVNTRIPPKVDLSQYGKVGLVTFTIENAKGQLHELATQKFSEFLLDAQRVEVLELGSADTVLRRVGDVRFAAASAQALGGTRDVPVIFAGHLKVSNVKPQGKVLGLNLPRIEADVSVELNVALFSAKTGATIWRSSASASEKVGSMGMSGGEPYFSAKDPNEAYGHLVNYLIGEVTHDMRATYVREQVRNR